MADAEASHTPGGSSFSIGRLLLGLDTWIARVEGVLLATGVLAMAANTIANVVARRMGQSLYFAEEVNQFLMVLITFVGISYGVRNARHIRMSAIYDQLGDTGKKLFTIVISLVTAAFMFGLAYYSYEYVSSVAARGRVTPALQVPLYLTYIWLPIGFTMAGIQYLLAVYRNLTQPEVYLSYHATEGYDETDHTQTTSV